jgi:hypothetical protein
MAKKKVPVNEPKQKQENVVQSPSPTTFEVFAKKKDTAFIAMTQEASMRADETAAKRRSDAAQKNVSYIHKIRDDK